MPDPRGWLVGTGVQAQVRSLGRCSVRPTACLHRPACSCTSAVSPRHKLNPVGRGKNRLSWQLGNTVTQCAGCSTLGHCRVRPRERVICLTRNPQVRLCSEELKDEDRMTHNMTPAADPLAQRVDRWRWGPELSGYLCFRSQPGRNFCILSPRWSAQSASVKVN